MTDERNTLQADIEALDRVLSRVRQAEANALRSFSTLHEQRARRLASLAERLPRDHPEAGVLREESKAASRLQQELAATAKRQARRPRLKPGQRLVFGRVLDRKGLPIAGLRIRISDKDGKFGGFTTVETDEHGDFAILTQVDDWPEPEKIPALHVIVENTRGQRLLVSRGKLEKKNKTGKSDHVMDYFLLVPEKIR